MSPPKLITDYFFDYVNSKNNKTKTIFTNSKKNYGKYFSKKNQRKNSLSSEGFEKIGFENLYEIEECITHPKSKSQKISFNNRDICEEIYEYKMKMYSDLLIERRKHYCHPRSEISSSLENEGMENIGECYIKDNNKNDMVEVYVGDNRYDIVESYVRLKCMNTLDENFKAKGK
jgi:hypothetical protein